jgi:pyruvate dehydrogenase E2 component (dihydrolipoamide acetyltransferase)
MAIQVVMPRLSDTMEEGKILRWLKKEGDRVEGGDILAEVQTDKADIEMEAFGSGILRKILVSEGESARVGHLIGVIAGEDEDISGLLPAPEGAGMRLARPAVTSPLPAAPPILQPVAGRRIKVSPLARRMAREQGIDLSVVAGSGPGGRVIRRDLAALAEAAGGAPPRAPLVSPARTAPEPSVAVAAVPVSVGFQEQELSPMRKAIAKRMSQSMASAPHFYLTVEVAMEKAMELRESIQAQVADLKVTVTDMIVKAAALALVRHPAINASFMGDRIRFYSQVHIGIAVALEDGLISPVLRECDRKSLAQIARDAGSLIERARSRKLKPEEYGGGTFTISNLGMFEIEEFTAIINPPEAAILAVGSIQAKPVVVDGQIRTGHRMRMTLSCDHRAVDGATGAKFLQEVKRLLEHPLHLVL